MQDDEKKPDDAQPGSKDEPEEKKPEMKVRYFKEAKEETEEDIKDTKDIDEEK